MKDYLPLSLAFMRRGAHRLHEASIVLRLVRAVGLPWDDGVESLRLSPLSMFFYNQRAIVLGFSTLIWLAFASAYQEFSSEIRATLAVLGFALVAEVLVTLLLHRKFRAALRAWASPDFPRDSPPLFDRYFLIDSTVLFLILLLGVVFSLPLRGFCFLLFANTFLYSAYSRSDYKSNPSVSAIIYSLSGMAVLVMASYNKSVEISWPLGLLYLAPLVGMISITLFSISMISWLRTNDHEMTRTQLSLLGKYETILAGDSFPEPSGGDFFYNEKLFRRKVAAILSDLCSLGYPFWYSASCLWFFEDHSDRKQVLVPGVSVNFPEARIFREGIETASQFLGVDSITLTSSLKADSAVTKEAVWRFRTDLDAPAALIPLRKEGARLGILAVYGEKGGPPAQRQEEAFLKSLASIIGNSMEEWEGRYTISPQKEMDDLFSCDSLAEVFPRAAQILRKYLFAEGCMILFRQDADGADMTMVASVGFRELGKHVYKVGRGQTGKCAATQKTVRVDDVQRHRDEFDLDLLRAIERARGRKITSWMAIPIGAVGARNYGVIKVVNSTFRCNWFTAFDEKIGMALALRLHVIIEKFLQMKRTERAKEEATQSAKVAEKAKREAEETARQRQQDLMNVTHQLQGALIGVVGALTGIKEDGLPKFSRSLLEHGRALVEDALTLAYGTFTSLARASGRETAFTTSEINAPEELRKLCQRLQMTNARHDLTFIYKAEPGFPVLKMDRDVFTSVMFSLIHNAMKYADRHSSVILECSFERNSDEAALKVKSTGEPIDPLEKDSIFEKFKRGKAVERGRRHSGVGLGLWVAKELMIASRGDLTVELSPYDPRFSIFIVHIPR